MSCIHSTFETSLSKVLGNDAVSMRICALMPELIVLWRTQFLTDAFKRKSQLPLTSALTDPIMLDIRRISDDCNANLIIAPQIGGITGVGLQSYLADLLGPLIKGETSKAGFNGETMLNIAMPIFESFLSSDDGGSLLNKCGNVLKNSLPLPDFEAVRSLDQPGSLAIPADEWEWRKRIYLVFGSIFPSVYSGSNFISGVLCGVQSESELISSFARRVCDYMSLPGLAKPIIAGVIAKLLQR